MVIMDATFEENPLRRELQELNDRHAHQLDLRIQNERSDILRTQVAAANEILEERNTEIIALNKHVVQLEETKANAESKIDILETKFKLKSEEVVRVQHELQTVSSKAKQLTEEIITHKAVIVDLQANASDLEIRTREAEKILGQVKREKDTLQSRYDQQEFEFNRRLKIKIDELTRLHNAEKDELRRRFEINNSLQLEKQIQELRKEYEDLTKSGTDRQKQLYKMKENELIIQIQRLQKSNASKDDQIQMKQQEIDDLAKKLSKSKGETQATRLDLADAQQKLVEVERQCEADKRKLERDIEEKQIRMDKQTAENSHLQDLKTSFDKETTTYKKLLDVEDDRIDRMGVRTQNFVN